MQKLNNEKVYFVIGHKMQGYEKAIIDISKEIGKKFEINAIIDKYALINGNSIEQNEEIDGHKLVELEMYFVILENETEKIKLEVDHGEYFKNFN